MKTDLKPKFIRVLNCRIIVFMVQIQIQLKLKIDRKQTFSSVLMTYTAIEKKCLHLFDVGDEKRFYTYADCIVGSFL